MISYIIKSKVATHDYKTNNLSLNLVIKSLELYSALILLVLKKTSSSRINQIEFLHLQLTLHSSQSEHIELCQVSFVCEKLQN